MLVVRRSWVFLSHFPWRSLRFLIWIGVLAGSVIGALVLSFRYSEKFWVLWEFTGLSFTIVYTFAMLRLWFFGPDPVNRKLKDDASGKFMACQFIIFVCQFVIVILLALSIVLRLYSWCRIIHVLFLEIMMIASLIAQFQIRDHPKEDMAGDPTYKKLREEASHTIIYGEMPTLVTFSVLCFFVLLSFFTPSTEDEIESFIGGAVAFQLLQSNIIFGINYAVR